MALNKQLPNPSKHGRKSKRANKHKLKVIKNTQRILGRISICNTYSSDTDKNSLVFQDGKPIIVSKSLSWNLANIRCKWDITCGVFCRDQKGNHWGYYTEFESKHECLSDDLTDLVLDTCSQMFENVAPKLEKLCPFWIATPRFDNQCNNLNLAIYTAHVFKVFNRLGTNFEIDCNKPIVDYHTGKKWWDIAKDFTWKEIELDFTDWYNPTEDVE